MTDMYGNETGNNYEGGSSGAQQQYGRQYGDQYSGQYQQPPVQPMYGGYPQDERQRDPVRVSEWVGTLLLMMIPLVNIVLCFVWAFGKNAKPSKSNFFRAYLIIFAAEIVLIIILLIIYMAFLLYIMG